MDSNLISVGKDRLLKFDCGECEYSPSIAKNSKCMREVLNQLEDNAKVDAVLLQGRYVQEYRDEDLELLKEFKKNLNSAYYLILKWLTSEDCSDCEKERMDLIENVWDRLRSEPWEGKKELVQIKKELKERSERDSERCELCFKNFLGKGIEPALELIADTKLIKKLEKEEIRKNRENLFNPAVRPDFLRSKISFNPPENAELVDAYQIDETKVRIYYLSERLEYLYFLIPPEYSLSPEKVDILQEVRQRLVAQEGSLDPDLAKREVEDRSRNLIMEIALEKNIDLEQEVIEYLSKSLAKFTAGLGIIGTLLGDDNVQDIYVDAPVGNDPLYIHHQEFEECLTNVFLTPKDAQVLTSRFRAISGRPFSEASPTLDLELDNVRVAAIKEPLSPDGLAFAIRRHKSTPWTLPLFVQNDFLSPEAAGLLSLIVDSQASILVTGSRGAGKTSLLGALMLEILPKYRILCLEDTAELPIEELRSLGYKAQRLQVRSPISRSEIEMDTEKALRAALRLGESVLVVGEVRGPETKSLYEAMRVGAAGNSVMGTIHGSSTEDVFERVVYDLGIPASSFKATDVIVVASPIREKGSIDRVRRLVQISEVGRDWEENPIAEDGFTDLMNYDAEEDKLKISTAVEKGESSLLNSIAENWAMSEEEVIKNLEVRSEIQKTLAEQCSSKGSELLEAENVLKSNLVFHRLLESELGSGNVDYDELYLRWEEELREEISHEF